MNANLMQLIPESVRTVIYTAIALAGVVLGTITATGYSAPWVEAATAAVLYLAGVFGVTAVANLHGTKPVGEKFTGTDADLLFTNDEELLAGPEPGETVDGEPIPVDEDDEPSGRRIRED